MISDPPPLTTHTNVVAQPCVELSAVVLVHLWWKINFMVAHSSTTTTTTTSTTVLINKGSKQPELQLRSGAMA